MIEKLFFRNGISTKWNKVEFCKKSNFSLTYLIFTLKPVQTMPCLELEFRARKSSMREVEDSAEQGVVRRRLPVARIGVQPYVKRLNQSLSMLFTCQGAGSFIEGIVPRQQQLQHFPRRGERSIRRQEDIDIRRLEFPVVVRQTFHQPLHRAGFQETHPHRLPFQMRDLVVRVLIGKLQNWSWEN